MYEVADHIDRTAAPFYGRPSLVGDLPAEAELFAQAVEPLELEGVVAKRRASAYTRCSFNGLAEDQAQGLAGRARLAQVRQTSERCTTGAPWLRSKPAVR